MTSNNPRRVGEGSYGCVHRPALKCKNKPYDPDPTKVSKILTKKNANDELKEFKLINAADKKEDFHLGKPRPCFPDSTEANEKAVNQCNRFNSFDMNKYKVLLQPNGGDNLSDIEQKLQKLTVNSSNRRRLENFWLDMARIIYGSKVLIDNGIVHHDLKQQNIVYNEQTGRVNFIDFGLMTTTKEMLKKANGSRYPFKEHWSFPPDILFYNYVDYKKLTSRKGGEKIFVLREEWKKYMIASAMLQDNLMDINEELATGVTRMIGAFFKTFNSLTNSDEDYKKFINKSFETFDNYAIGFSLFSILKSTKDLIDKKLCNDLRLLFLSMMSFDVFSRPTSSQVVDKYEFILKSNGLLDKYNMRFENHFLVDGTEKKEQEKSVEKLPTSIKKLVKELIIVCPKGKERNPKTKRCINKCKEDYSRDADFKCKKNKTQKNKKEIIPSSWFNGMESTLSEPVEIIYDKPRKTSTKKKSHKKTQKKASLKACVEGKERNPKTRRCVKKCKVGYLRDKEFKCKKDKK